MICPLMNVVYGQTKSLRTKGQDTFSLKVDTLKVATVTGTLRPRMKRDTLEYNTEHFRMPPNAVVEELLRRLPGLHVDPNGTITFNGEKIVHLLVDGEDVFGSDPTIVTRNIDASKIAQVQILDRKSDETLFTGIDDGIRVKALNLVMKESAKNGYFGKVEGGGSADGYYNSKGVLAGFRNKEQFMMFGLASNTGTTNFTSNAGGALAGVDFLNGNTDALGASAGTGIPQVGAAVLHYANTWDGSLNHLTANYQYSHYYTQPMTNTQSLQAQTGSVYKQDPKSHSTNQQDQHWLYGIYDWVLSPRTAIKLVFHGNNSLGRNQFGSSGSSTFNDTLVNRSERMIRDHVNGQNIGGSASGRIRIGKSNDRIFSINASIDQVDNTTNGYLYSVNRYYQSNGFIQSVDTVDQRKAVGSQSLSVGSSINFRDPIWGGAVLGLSYGASYTEGEPLQATYDRGNGKYQELVDSLSSHFKTGTVNQRGMISIQGKIKHLGYILGADWIGYCYHQEDLIGDSTIRQKYNNLAPRALVSYTPSRAIYISLNYNTYTQQPTIAQLTPTTNNDDPLHITLGNPGLRPGFNQNFKLDFRWFKMWLMNLSLTTTFSSNSISTKTTIDGLGRQISQPLNVGGGRTGGFNFSANRKVLGFDLGVEAVGTYGRTVNYVNADLSRNDVYTGGGGISLGKFVVGKYSLQASTNFAYFDQVSSINSTASLHYWTQSHQGMLTIYLIPNIEVGTSANYTWQEKSSAFASNTTVLLWNGYVARNFMHNKVVAKFQFNNILNANAGISRTNSGNINTQSATNILGRYWMVSAIYHFDRKIKK